MTGREPASLNPATDAAKIRAIFVHPGWARRGLGSLMLEYCEEQARAAGFTRLEMGSTLTGAPLYRLRGYVAQERIAIPLPNGEVLPVIRMTKSV
jgi:GNAT superfamily N-acetyltransferase